MLHPELEADRELLHALLERHDLPLYASIAISAAANELLDPPALPALRHVSADETADPLQAVRAVRERLTAAALAVRGGTGEAMAAARAARELAGAETLLAAAMTAQRAQP